MSEYETKAGREEKETKPRDPAEAPKSEEEKEWEAAAPHPTPAFPPPSILSANCAALKAFIISDFSGVIF